MSQPAPPSGRIAAIDFGTVRIGIALSNSDRTWATPYEIYARRNPALDAEYFRKLVRGEAVALFVVGLPVHTSGKESKKSLEAKAFGSWLAEQTGIAVEYFDERFTSTFAEQMLQEAGFKRKGMKERIDKLAAQILLTAYLESTTRGAAEPGALED